MSRVFSAALTFRGLRQAHLRSPCGCNCRRRRRWKRRCFIQINLLRRNIYSFSLQGIQKYHQKPFGILSFGLWSVKTDILSSGIRWITVVYKCFNTMRTFLTSFVLSLLRANSESIYFFSLNLHEGNIFFHPEILLMVLCALFQCFRIELNCNRFTFKLFFLRRGPGGPK